MTLFAIPFPDIDPVAISVGPLSIKWYGLAYMAGLLIGWYYVKRLIANASLWRNGRAPLTEPMTDDLLLAVTLGVVLGGRIGHVLFYEPGYYLSNPVQILKIWQGGMAFHGGVLGVIVALWLVSRWRNVPLLSLGDVVTAAVPVGLFFGRIANFINSEVVGTVSNVPWAIAFPGYGPEPRHPAMLYEAFLEGLVLFAILYWLIHKRGALRMPGLTAGAFLLGYGLFRIVVEVFKIEEYRILFPGLPITRGMAYSVPMVIAGLYFILLARRNARRSSDISETGAT